MNINLEDPRLSAYALGEMDSAEVKEFEALLEKDPAARAEVEALRQMAGMLASKLQAEPAEAMSEPARAKVVAAAEANIVPLPRSRRRVVAARLAKIAAVLLVVAGVVYVATPQLARSNKAAREAAQGAVQGDALRFEMSRLQTPKAGGPAEPVPAAPSAASVPPAPSASVPPAPAPEPKAPSNAQAGVEKEKAEPMKEVKLDIPKPMFVGTPKNLGNVPPAPATANGPADAKTAIEAQKQLPEASQPAGITPYRVNVPPAGQAAQSKSSGSVEQMTKLNVRADFTEPVSVQQFGRELAPGVPGYQGGYGGGMGGVIGAPGTESYKPIVENEFKLVRNEPLSTFSIDVDTASYANVRRFLNDGQLPPPDAVRIEELVNYFKYDYPEPEGDSPFSATVEVNACPWNRDHALALVGLKGRSAPMNERPPINLVFLIDVSGSMQPENKLPLLKKAMRLLADSLGGQDRVGIVTYASNTGVALPSTNGGDKARILSVLDVLQAGGSTNGAGGIQLAYEMAAQNFIRGGVNRIVLATDGDFNVGISDTAALVQFIEDKAKSGVFLSVLGFGEGNLQDDKLEGLADKGNGHYAYIDSFAEARRVLLDDVAGTMVAIAKDVKIQIEFNPARVGGYRLIGYENRVMAAQDFNDDRKDAGEIGSGHTVTALYELVPPDRVDGLGGVDPLKYQPNQAEPPQADAPVEASPELMTVKLRYKQPDGDKSAKSEMPVLTSAGGEASPNFKFASSVAMFGMLLRGSRFSGTATFDMVMILAEEARGADKNGQRTEFAGLVQTARALARRD